MVHRISVASHTKGQETRQTAGLGSTRSIDNQVSTRIPLILLQFLLLSFRLALPCPALLGFASLDVPRPVVRQWLWVKVAAVVHSHATLEVTIPLIRCSNARTSPRRLLAQLNALRSGAVTGSQTPRPASSLQMSHHAVRTLTLYCTASQPMSLFAQNSSSSSKNSRSTHQHFNSRRVGRALTVPRQRVVTLPCPGNDLSTTLPRAVDSHLITLSVSA